MKALGICLGATNITMVELGINENKKIKINKSYSITHEGNPKKILSDKLKKLNLKNYDYIGFTGRKFRKFVNLQTITEPEATELAYNYIKNLKDNDNITIETNKNKIVTNEIKNNYKNVNAIVSAGGETFMVYLLDSNGKISNVYTGNKCASGTGEFFLQQLRRMNLNVKDAIIIAKNEHPHKVTGRCSVFCKSDCTHALNKGIPKGEVTAGLCEMMAKKVLELLSKIQEKDNIMIIGGTAQNDVVISYLKKELKNVIVPKEAPYFEALGAGIYAINNSIKPDSNKSLFKEGKSPFSFHKPISNYTNKVTFKTIVKTKAKENDECILGLDVGSTTTKAVLIRTKDDAILASCYLRTNGNPIQASRECYTSLQKQIEKVKIKIIGLGVTGSGRHIAGLHAFTDGIINEIIAHATAAVYFDPEVDTIFEIGGQDAKYTYITNSVPSDYAMNEACSAGTGSFLEESAKESLGVDVKDISGIALKGKNPPNFNDQCAAFISSDIKTAFQEGIEKEDIVAGLVYSICLNYSNRVKGNRPVGKKVFMQGGVCYNKSVPIAMAALTGNEIIVPPEPGLMGAFGVALVIKDRLKLGLLTQENFILKDLIERDVEYGKNFICGGGSEKCDRKCEVMTIKINGKIFPFGGACDKYYNQRLDLKFDVQKLNLIELRQKLMFEKYASILPKKNNSKQKTIGINKSFLTNTFYPLFYNFFTKLGMKVILSENVSENGCDKRGAAFCYPAEISHGLFYDLLKKKPDFIFLPIILEIPIKSKNKHKKTCVFIQGEHAYLKTAFKNKLKELKNTKLLSPVLNFSHGFGTQKNNFVKIAKKLGFSKKNAISAYDFASNIQKDYYKETAEIGKKIIKELESDFEQSAIVLFGRSYNAYAKEANMGIPHKFASRGSLIIPADFIPYEHEEDFDKMYWGMGQLNLKAAKYVKNHPQLFGTFVSNFSCGPDSFIISYFRNIMGIKPSLTLELDSHTADAGLNTRIDAFIDIIKSFRELLKANKIHETVNNFKPAQIMIRNNQTYVISSSGEKHSLTDPNVTILLPSMGRIGTETYAAGLRGIGIKAKALPIADAKVLQIGRANTSCKECLPMQITTGSLLNYVEKHQKQNELIVFFMPESNGPCRFGQYNIFMRKLIEKNKIKDVAFLSLTCENSYAGLGNKFTIAAWMSIIISDVLTDIYNAIIAIAENKKKAIDVFEAEFNKIKLCMENKVKINIYSQIKQSCEVLKKIPLKIPFDKAEKISLIGEIFVRRDELSQQGIVNDLAKKGIIVKIAPVSEFVYYVNYANLKNYGRFKNASFSEKLKIRGTLAFQKYTEKKVKNLFSKSGLYEFEMVDIDKTIDHGKHIINPNFAGEAILTTGLALREVLHTVSGVISIGPFACMPARVAEAVLTEEMTLTGKAQAAKKKHFKDIFEGVKSLPFLAVETDGNPYPQIIEARIETLCLQSKRIHDKMKKFK